MLNSKELETYARHISLSEIGLEGQEKLKNSKILIIGSGGLGSPNIMYLAAAGVGTIGIVDFDNVDNSNLQRQVIHSVDTVGKPKVKSASSRASSINPHINIIEYNIELNNENAEETFKDFDIVVDCTDNIEVREIINETSLKLRIPMVYGSILQFHGQVSVFNLTENSPCYKCFFKGKVPKELSPSGKTGGVIGVLPGITGTIQANEVLKLILNIGVPLSGYMLMINTLNSEFGKTSFVKDPECRECSCHD